jgi:proteasome lid subunit RPN8/RPN11
VPSNDDSAVEDVHLLATVVCEIVAHAVRDSPDECCGLLIGTAERIDTSYPARNLRRSPTRFLIDPVDHFAAIRFARDRGLSVVGAYHSHPASAPEPSPTDDEEATTRNFLYMIVSPATGEVRGFRMADTRLESVRLV